MRAGALALAALVVGVEPSLAQQSAPCRILCAPELKIEPTITFSNLFGSPRVVGDDGTVTREPRETDFEVILSLGLPTHVPWLDFTVEAIFLPFDRESTPELEFETNFVWLPGARTGGWVSSQVKGYLRLSWSSILMVGVRRCSMTKLLQASQEPRP